MRFDILSPQYQEIADDIGNAVLKLSGRPHGPFRVKHEQVGTHSFDQYEAYYHDSMILTMYETRGGDHDYLILLTTDHPAILTGLALIGQQ